MNARHWILGVALSGLPAGIAGASPTLGQIDTFADGTTDGWTIGRSSSPFAPQNVSTGGPAGASDAFLNMTSSGTGGPGSKAIIFNQSQWAGDYLSAGITEIDMDLKNLGSSSLTMRIALDQFKGGPGYETVNGFSVPADGAWHHATFKIDSADLTPLESPPSLNTVLSNVSEVRVLSAASPSLDGDLIASSIGIDNVQAVPEPVSGSLLLVRRRWCCDAGGELSLATGRRTLTTTHSGDA